MTMGEYEPDDSRDVTLTEGRPPLEPEKTGPREQQKPANQTDVDNGSVQRSGHEPKNTDLSRGSEPATRAASHQRG
jgi:hypothetical protein